jgi:hypothetical protein
LQTVFETLAAKTAEITERVKSGVLKETVSFNEISDLYDQINEKTTKSKDLDVILTGVKNFTTYVCLLA